MVRELWNIGWEYKNEEVFSLSIEILKPYEVVPMPSRITWWQLMKIHPEKWKNENLLELGKSSYHWLVRTWIREILDATLQVMKPFDLIAPDFTYDMKWSSSGSITISSNYRDPLMSKKFIETISGIFRPITSEKYTLHSWDMNNWMTKKTGKSMKKVENTIIQNILVPSIILSFFWSIFVTLRFWDISYFFTTLFIPPIFIFILSILTKFIRLYFNKRYYTNNLPSTSQMSVSCGIPELISSNEDKRRRFIGREYGEIPEGAKWYNSMSNWLDLALDSIKKIFSPFDLLKYIKPDNKEKNDLENWMTYFVMLIVYIIRSFLYVILLPIIPILTVLFLLLYYIFCILYWFILFIIYLINFPYKVFSAIINLLKRRKIIQLIWSIEPNTQSDIGKPSFLSAKIEKLWI